MRYYKAPLVNGVVDTVGIEVDAVAVVGDVSYIAHSNKTPKDSWVEITEEEFRQYVPEPEPYLPEPEPYLPEQETTDQKLARIEEQNIILMDALATTFEEIIALRELVEGGTK
jgi:hypothetical protein